MCLNLGQQLQPVVAPTEKAKHCQKLLIGMDVAFFILVFMQCFVDVWQGMNNMILVLMVACVISNMNHCCLAMYMIYITLGFLNNICWVGLVI